MLNDTEFNREFSKGIVTLMMECVAPLQKKIEALEAREVKHGRDGKDADPAEVAAIVLKSIQVPQDGKDGAAGQDGKSVALEEVMANLVPLVEQRIEKLFSELPKPVDGKDGINGVNGKDGLNGKDGMSPDVADVAALVLKSIQLPKDGKDGRDGAAGKDGLNGKDGASPDLTDVAALVLKSIQMPKDGKDGAAGKDGVGLAGAIINRSGELVITKTDGGTQNLGIVVGKDGEPGPKGKDGAPGRDGFGFDDMEAIEEGLRFGHRFRRGDLVKEFWYNKPTLADFDHEIWREGTSYPRGAVVTLGGSLYICKQETKQRPETASGAKDWRLAVKCGRHGANGAMGPMGPAGPPGKDGRMVGFDNRPL